MAVSGTIEAELTSLVNERSKLVETLNKIKEALSAVTSAQAEFNEVNANGSSFTYVSDNMDIYWDAAESEARATIKEKLKEIAKQFTEGGSINTACSTVISAANEKIAELENSIQELNAKIEAKKVELENASTAELK